MSEQDKVQAILATNPQLHKLLGDNPSMEELVDALTNRLRMMETRVKAKNEPTAILTAQVRVSLRDKLSAVAETNSNYNRRMVIEEALSDWMEKHSDLIPDNWEAVAEERKRNLREKRGKHD